MIAHYFKLIWKRKGKNAFLFVQLIFVFWVVFAVFSYGISQYRYYASPLGFDWREVYRVQINFKTEDTAATRLMIKSLKHDLKAMPETDQVSYSVNVSPYLGNIWGNGNDNDGFVFNARYMYADEDYARVWKIPMKSGRFYTREDLNSKYTPVVVTQKFVDKFMKGKEPLGFKFHFTKEMETEIIGVAENFKFQGDFTEEDPFLFVPLADDATDLHQAINVRVKPGTGPEVEKKINDLVENATKNNDFSLVKVDITRKSTNSRTYIPLAAMFFLAIFLIINISMGLFGILRYNIARRIPEIGLRKAVGASTGAVRRQFTGEMLVLVVLAFVIAVIFAVQLPFITTLPIEKDAYFMGIGAGALLIFVLVYGCTLAPSQQAAMTLPAKALHEE
ncbi:MAG: ABC transporter permease [Leadbetterella sp.]|nr:ABC transporter permease [Leadbetterella sp.]